MSTHFLNTSRDGDSSETPFIYVNTIYTYMYRYILCIYKFFRYIFTIYITNYSIEKNISKLNVDGTEVIT